MAAETREDGQTYEVRDDGEVDTMIKKRIIEARDRVRQREDYLYVKAPVEDGLTANRNQQDIYWGMMVKQFLRTIRPLLRAEEVKQSRKYYQDVELGSVQLVPRNSGDIPFEEYARSEVSPVEFKTRYDIAGHATLPEPTRRSFIGLQSVIETSGVVRETWTVELADGDVIQTVDEKPVPKDIYETALWEADEFLQEAGIGLDVGAEKVESRPEPI